MHKLYFWYESAVSNNVFFWNMQTGPGHCFNRIIIQRNTSQYFSKYIRQTKNEINKNTFFLGVKKWMNKTLSMIFYQSAHCAQQPPISRCLRYLVRTKRCDCCLQCLNSVIKWVSNWEVKFYNIFTRKNICYCFFEKYGKQCTQINKVC